MAITIHIKLYSHNNIFSLFDRFCSCLSSLFLQGKNNLLQSLYKRNVGKIQDHSSKGFHQD